MPPEYDLRARFTAGDDQEAAGIQELIQGISGMKEAIVVRTPISDQPTEADLIVPRFRHNPPLRVTPEVIQDPKFLEYLLSSMVPPLSMRGINAILIEQRKDPSFNMARLLNMSRKDLLAIRNIGEKSASELEEGMTPFKQRFTLMHT